MHYYQDPNDEIKEILKRDDSYWESNVTLETTQEDIPFDNQLA